MKRCLCLLLAALLLPAAGALADGSAQEPGDACITMGADLTNAQRAAVYADFGVEPGTVQELRVTNAEERIYLEKLVPDRKIGSVALSCIYIRTLDEGAGLTIEIRNINYCTEAMYQNALVTAGVRDAHVIVSAPFPVSGTGALTGAYKAYENITGSTLSQLAKQLGAEELVLTGELAEYIGSQQAAEIIAELKKMLDRSQQMTDAQVRSEIDAIAGRFGVSLTAQQRAKVLELTRKLEGLSETELQSKLVDLAGLAQKAGRTIERITRVYESVSSFFGKAGDFLIGLFK